MGVIAQTRAPRMHQYRRHSWIVELEQNSTENCRGTFMRGLKFLVLTAVAGGCFTAAVPEAQAAVGINIGVAPVCPYGYYDAAPYGCAPSGYYGPEWFRGDVFIGAGPWFHGPHNFRGNVNNAYHPAHGYQGPTPERGEKFDPARRVDSAHFSGNEERDGRGHVTGGKR